MTLKVKGKVNNMNKTEFINAFATRLEGVTKKEATDYTNAFLETMQDALVNDGSLVFTNAFTMTVKEIDEREGRNPKTGETITIPARKRAFCTFGMGFKQSINAPAKKAPAAKKTAKKAVKKVVAKKK